MATSPKRVSQVSRTPHDEMFRLLLESVPDHAIFMLDAAGLVTSWNGGAERLLGYGPAEVLGRDFSTFYVPEDVAAGNCRHELTVATRDGRFESEGWQLRKDGSRFWAEVVLSAMRSGEEELVGFAKITRDLSERRESMDSLRRSEERLRLLVDSVRDYAICMLDRSGRVVTWNVGAERLKGYRAEDILGRPGSVFYPAEDVATGLFDRELRTARADGRVEAEGWRVRKDGTRFWANAVMSAINDSDGQLRGYACVTRDLTERVKAEDTRLRLAQTEEAVRLRDEFLSIASHELRTPLTPLSMYLQGIDRNLRSGRTVDRGAVGKAQRQVRRMSRLIDELLDLTRIQEGQLDLERAVIDLAALVAVVVQDFQDVSEKHEIVLDSNGPILVNADHPRLEQVLVNLVQNAVKYSPAGGLVRIAVKSNDREATVSVTDQGIGIPKDEQAQLFERFFRARNAAPRHFGGLGLGLFLSHEIVKRHGGGLAVESELSKGSTFTFTMPVADRTELELPVVRRLLLVDDDPFVLDAVGDALRTDGYAVETVASGMEALAAIARSPPDLMLVDLMMPVLDGASLIERIRREDLLVNTPIVLFSGDQQVHRKASALRVDAAFQKPIDLAELQAGLARLLHRQKTATSPK